MEDKMIDYLKLILKVYLHERQTFGISRYYIHEQLVSVRACRDMIEQITGKQINLAELEKEIKNEQNQNV